MMSTRLVVALVERHKAEALWVEVELDFADGTISVFGDDEVRDVCKFRIVRFVITGSVNE